MISRFVPRTAPGWVAVVSSLVVNAIIILAVGVSLINPPLPPSETMPLFNGEGICRPDYRALAKALCSELPDRIFHPSASHFERTSAIRDWAHQNVDLGSSAVLAGPEWHQLTVSEMYRRVDRDEAGVWCGGTSHFLARIYEMAGYRTWVLGFGFYPDLLTHKTTLVEIPTDEGPKIILQDAYFNFTLVDEDGQPLDIGSALTALSIGRGDEVVIDETLGMTKDVLFAPEEAQSVVRGESDSWAEIIQGTCSEVSDGVSRCKTRSADLAHLANHPLYSPTLDEVEVRGLPRSIEYLMVFPIDIFNREEGYFTDPEAHPLLAEIFEATNGFAEEIELLDVNDGLEQEIEL